MKPKGALCFSPSVVKTSVSSREIFNFAPLVTLLAFITVVTQNKYSNYTYFSVLTEHYL